MKYGAITVDTNIFSINGYNLEGGLLVRLYQFNRKAPRLILSEIVLRELNRHLYEQSKEAQQSLSRAITKSNFNAIHDDRNISKLREVLDSSLDPKRAALSRIDKFIVNTGAKVISADKTDIKSLIKHYFETLAPFEGAGKKKNEFPDAIALLSLEAWARENDTTILAISDDKGWSEFAAKSKWIDVETDLRKALEILQTHTEEARLAAENYVKEMAEGMHRPAYQQVKSELSKDLRSKFFEGVAQSAHRAESNYVSGELQEFNFVLEDGEAPIDIVEISEDSIVAIVGVEATVRFEGEFNIYLYDSVDKEEVGIGSAESTVEKDVDMTVILSFAVGEKFNVQSLDVKSVELMDYIDTIDFGYVELDIGEPDFDIDDDVPSWAR